MPSFAGSSDNIYISSGYDFTVVGLRVMDIRIIYIAVRVKTVRTTPAAEDVTTMTLLCPGPRFQRAANYWIIIWVNVGNLEFTRFNEYAKKIFL